MTRIIPAYAGSTMDKDRMSWASTDHPRVCGEHAEVGRTAGGALGSSPRMRGALS